MQRFISAHNTLLVSPIKLDYFRSWVGCAFLLSQGRYLTFKIGAALRLVVGTYA